MSDNNNNESTNRRGANFSRKAPQVVKSRSQPTMHAVGAAAAGHANTLRKSAGGGSGMASSQLAVIRNLPKVYSPLYEMTNLMLPRDQKTINSWCLTGEALILTEFFEWKAIKDLTIGERVFTHTGTIAPIKDIMCREVDEEIVEVFVKGSHNPISITGNHQLYVLQRNTNECKANHNNICKFNKMKICKSYRCEDKKMKFADVKSADLQVGDHLAYPINKDFVDSEYWTMGKARLLGLYAAEGNAAENLAQVGLTFNVKEADLAEETANLLQSEFGRKGCLWNDPNYNITRTYTTNELFKRFVLDHCGRGSHTKRFSNEVMFLDPKLQLAIIGGYIDGDGYQDKRSRVTIDTVSDDLARQIQWMCYRNEINTYIGKYTRIENPNSFSPGDSEFWRIEIPAVHAEKLSKVSTRVKSCKMKVNRCDRFFNDNYLLTPITRIDKKHFTGKVYNIEVDHNDHSYVTSVGAVHNCRHFWSTNPIVRNAINLHATYPISKFNIICEEPKVKAFFEEMFDKLNLKGLLLGIALEFFKIGEAFPYLELNEDHGVWEYGFLHNPDFIRIKTSPLARDPVIALVPDDTLKRIVQGKSPADASLLAQISKNTIMHIMKGEDIPLSNFNISHLKMMSADYDGRGQSIIVSVFKDLMLYDKIREAQIAQADGMINPVTLVKLGDPNGTWKPSDEDIQSFQQIMEESQYDPDFKIITHGAVSIERVGYSGATLDTGQMWEAITRNIFIGLMAPEAVLSGEGASYATATVGLEVLRSRYERFREQLSQWIVRKVMEPIAKLQDFYVRKGGKRQLIVPQVIWNKLNLRDMDSYVGNMIGLLAADDKGGKISDETMFEILDIDYEEERKRLRKELVHRTIAAKETEALGKMSLEELRTLDVEKPIVDIHKGEEVTTPASDEQEGGMDMSALSGGGLGGAPSSPKPPNPSKGGGGGSKPSASKGETGGGEIGMGAAPPAPPAGPSPALPPKAV